MERKQKWIDPMRRIIEYHEAISEYVEDFEEALVILYDKQIVNKTKPTEDFFKRNVIAHFTFEEERVFPIIRAAAQSEEITVLVEELEAEHGEILKDVREFLKLAAENKYPLDREARKKLYTVGKSAIDALLRHASKEDEQLIPVIRKHEDLFKT